MDLLLLELRSTIRRRSRNPLGLLAEGAFTGGILILIERLMPGMGREAVIAKQIMFIASVMALPAVQGLHRMIAEESAYGTMEALFQVRGGVLKAFFARDAGAVLSVVMLMPLMGSAVALSSEIPPASYLRYIAPILIMRYGLLGTGIVLGAMTLLFRRTAAVINAASIMMVVTSLGTGLGKGFLSVLSSLFPHGLLARQMQAGASPAEMIPSLLLSSSLWILLGIAVYNLAVRRARRFGLLIN